MALLIYVFLLQTSWVQLAIDVQGEYRIKDKGKAESKMDVENRKKKVLGEKWSKAMHECIDLFAFNVGFKEHGVGV